MKILLIASALVYLVGLWTYTETRRADYLERARVTERQPARAGDEPLAFVRGCPGSAGCLPDPASLVERAGERAASGRRFPWLSGQGVPPPSYRSRNPCENEANGCRQPHEGESDARFELVSACNPRILACN